MIKFDRKNLNVPNALTLLRIVLIVPFVWFFFTDQIVAAIVTLILSACSDLLDGFIARHFNQSTALGKMLDPMADKLTQSTIALCIAWKVPILTPILTIFVIKEILMLIGGFVLLRKGKIPSAAKWYGKLATILFYLTVFFIIGMHLLFGPTRVVQIISVILLGITALVMIYAFVRYAGIFIRQLRQPEETSVRALAFEDNQKSGKG